MQFFVFHRQYKVWNSFVNYAKFRTLDYNIKFRTLSKKAKFWTLKITIQSLGFCGQGLYRLQRKI